MKLNISEKIYNLKPIKEYFEKKFDISAKKIISVRSNHINYQEQNGAYKVKQYQKEMVSCVFNPSYLRFFLGGIITTLFSGIPVVALLTDTSSTNNKDGNNWEGAPTTNYGSTANINVTGSNSGGATHGFINFTMASGSGTISDVKLYLYKHTNYAAVTINAHEITQAGWTEAGFTWNTYDGSNSWATAGGDYNATIIDAVSVGATTGIYYNWVLMGTGSDNPLTLTWGNTVDIHLRSATQGVNNGSGFYSKENGSNNPYLEITYTPAATGNFFLLF